MTEQHVTRVSEAREESRRQGLIRRIAFALLMLNGARHALVQHLHTNKCWDEAHLRIGRQPLTHANHLRVEPGH